MLNLIRAELFKLKRNYTFWVLIGVVAVVYTLANYLVVIDWWKMYNTGFHEVGLKEYNAMESIKLPIIFNLIISTLAGSFINSEYITGTIKNQVLSGNKRSHIYLAKLIVFSFGAIITSVILPIATAIGTTFLLGHGEIYTSETIFYLLRSFSLYTLIIIAYSSIVMFIASLTRESGKTIIITTVLTIILFIIEKTLVSRFEIIGIIYQNYIFYEIYTAFSPVITSNEIIKSILISVATLIVMTYIGIMVFRKKEIK